LYRRCAPPTTHVGYDSFWSFYGSGYAGVVTFVRTGLTKSFTDNPFDSVGESAGRCMFTDHGEFSVLNIYAPNAGRGPEYLERKMAFYEQLSAAMERWIQESRKVVVTGDINTAHTELDIYNPKKYAQETGFLTREREWISTFLQQRKCVDVWRELNPGVRKYAFWDQKRCILSRCVVDVVLREKNCGWRIDVFYANEKMMKDVVSSDILSNVRLFEFIDGR
jgi:exodeoxyribonuclease-3